MSTAVAVRVGRGDKQWGAPFDFEKKFQRVVLKAIKRSFLPMKARAIFKPTFNHRG